MIIKHRRLLGTLFALAAVGGTALFASAAGALPPGSAPTGALSITPATGNSGAAFQLAFTGTDQFCAGDGVAGYRWGTFITPITNDPATVTFGGSGSAAGPAFTTSLRAADASLLRAQFPGTGDGFINLSVNINFASPQFGEPMPAGDYWIGVACTFVGEGGTADSIEYWVTSITATDAAGAGPNNFTYGPTAAVETTTSTSTTTTTTTVAATTTTVAGATTTTTAVGATTSTTPGASTTSTLAGGGASTTTTAFGSGTPTTLFPSGGAGGSGTFTTTPTRTIANAGSNTGGMLLVAALLLIGGRMVILTARRTKILPPEDR